MHSERSGVAEDVVTDRPEGRAAQPTARTVAARVDGMKMLAGALGQLPVTLRFWDGSAARSPPIPTPRSSWSASRRRSPTCCTRPARSGSARAWVTRRARRRRRPRGACSSRAAHFARARALAAATVRGSRSRRCGSPDRGCCAARPCPPSEARTGGRLHSLAPRPRRDPPPLRRLQRASTELLLGPSMVYSCAYFADAGRHARGRAGAQARADLPQAAARSRASGCSTSAAAGARCSCTPPSTTACAASA